MKKGGEKVTNKKGEKRKERENSEDRTHARSIEFEL